MCKNFISQLKDIRLQLEGCESRTIHKIRSPIDKDPVKECAQRINDQQVPLPSAPPVAEEQPLLVLLGSVCQWNAPPPGCHGWPGRSPFAC